MKRIIAMALAVLMIVVASVAGTIAWLSDTTGPVENVFTTSNIDITLEETEREYKMVPGYDIPKDPIVTVEKDSEACWLFIKVEESADFANYMTYGLADGWEFSGVPGIYCREVNANAADQGFHVLNGDKVTVNTTVNKAMMDAIDNGTVNAPTLSFTAYATQLYKNATEKFTVAEAMVNLGLTP